jgi:ABC-type Zn uptake system ZnuABC Zn-binding protein ZnuA
MKAQPPATASGRSEPAYRSPKSATRIALLRYCRPVLLALSTLGPPFASLATEAEDRPLDVCVTVPELGDLTHAVGGEQVSVAVFAKGTEDPATVVPRPGFVKALTRADLYVQLGRGLEAGWAPQLLRSAGNESIMPGARGYLDASQVLSESASRVSFPVRSEAGTAYYLLDPLNGLRVAALIRDRLIELRPEQHDGFTERYRAFARELAARLVGAQLAKMYGPEDIEKLAGLFEHDNLGTFLEARGQLSLLAGWFGEMYPHYGDLAIADSNVWRYFARRFGLKILGEIEPSPGIAPTTRHLRELVRTMRQANIKLAIVTVYYAPRHAQFLAEHTGAQVLRLAHRVGSVPAAQDYLSMIDYDVRQLAAHGTHPPRPGRFEIHRHQRP